MARRQRASHATTSRTWTLVCASSYEVDYLNPKTEVENALHSAVCSHKVTLAAAQHAIATDWPKALADLAL